jgi:selenide,water dikinase
VDDPYVYGQIAAANSLSDIYAMGGRPMSALSIVAFPAKGDPEVLSRIMCGGFDKMIEAGCAVLGGHSVADEQVKFGYAVTGAIHPDRILPNAGACAGDVLILTKRIGTGVITTALKRGVAEPEHVNGAVESMATLNRRACEIMLCHPVHGCTDISGFGLLGHARELAKGSNVTVVIDHRCVEFLPGALQYSALGALPGGLKNNREFVSCAVEMRGDVLPEIENLLYDPQTSGGLLISVESSSARGLAEELRSAGVPASVVGEVSLRQDHSIIVL